MKLSEKGFTLVETLLVILILAVLGFTGYYVWHAKSQTNKSLAEADKTSQSAITAVATDLKPFEEALSRAGVTQQGVMKTAQIEDSETPGYKIAIVHVNGPGANFFYSKDGGKTYTYVNHASGESACNEYKTSDAKAAFKGWKCADTSQPDAPESTVTP